MNIIMLSLVGHKTGIYYLTSLAKAFIENEAITQITIFVPRYTNINILNQNINIIKFSFPKNLWKAIIKSINPFFLLNLLKSIKKARPDIVHIVYEIRVSFLLASLLHRKYPLVVTVHEPKADVPTYLRSTLLNPIQNTNLKLLLKFTDKIIVHGQKFKEYLLKQKIPSSKVDVISHGSFFNFNKWSNKDVGMKKNNILFFGRIFPGKGVDYMIKAGKLLEKEFPQITITIAGSGNFEKYKRLICGDKHFAVDNRYIPDNEVARFFQQASIVVMPYTIGSQSGIISIAASFKKPVVATNVGNFSEVIDNGKTGVIVPPKNAQILAEEIAKLLRDERLRVKMGENAYFVQKEKFSWEKVALGTLSVYRGARAKLYRA